MFLSQNEEHRNKSLTATVYNTDITTDIKSILKQNYLHFDNLSEALYSALYLFRRMNTYNNKYFFIQADMRNILSFL